LFIAKNIVLGGVKSATLHDTGSVNVEDLSSQVYHADDLLDNCADF
jgi:molybdopterin/thiamine biosynthesis adenylyltransferase